MNDFFRLTTLLRYSSPVSLLLSTSLLLSACAESLDSTGSEAELEQVELALLDGTPEGVGILRMLNDSKLTFEMLDIDAALDRRAAQGVMDFLHGADGIQGTRDDRRFQTIAQVDAIRYIGPVAMDRLTAYAHELDYVPQAGDLLGVFDDTAFTVDEATRALTLVNTASDEELDVDVALDRRAVRSIAAARPISSLSQLARLYYVGPRAMLWDIFVVSRWD